MNLWFVDDSRQRTPSRSGMGPLVAVGGLCVPESHAKPLEAELESLCSTTGFGRTEEFKWSPGRELWMHSNLKDQSRTRFFQEAFTIAAKHSVLGIFVVADSDKGRATPNASNSETDVVQLLLERIHNVTPYTELALVIADRPGGGGVPASDAFSALCLETIRTGTNIFDSLPQISHVLTCGSNLLRSLQLADVFTSCLTAYISGEPRFAPQLISSIYPLIRGASSQRVGGVGIKIHPDFKYANLYHWLFGDSYFWRGNCGHPMPLGSRPYSVNADAL